jgi:hypothetical protein
LPVEGAERGFDRGAEAGYTMPNTPAEKRIQTPDLMKTFGERTAEGLPGCDSQYNSARCLAATVSRNFALIYPLLRQILTSWLSKSAPNE